MLVMPKKTPTENPTNPGSPKLKMGEVMPKEKKKHRLTHRIHGTNGVFFLHLP